MKRNFLTAMLSGVIIIIFCQDPAYQPVYGSNREVGQYAELEGFSIYYETYGDGVPLLLLHGGVGSISNYALTIPELEKNFKVIIPDMPGHARSSFHDTLSYALIANQVSQFIDYLKIDSCYTVGWSSGGVIALHLAANRPDKVKKAIAVGANLTFSGLTSHIQEWTRTTIVQDFLDNEGWRSQYVSLMAKPEQLKSFLENTRKMWMDEIAIPIEKVASIDIPVLLIQGDKDEIKLEEFLLMHGSIKNSQMCILPNTTHFAFTEKPHLMPILINDFLLLNR